MLEQLKNSTENERFEKNEKLFRAVLKIQWANGKPSSAAFKLREKRNEKELSFDRQKDRPVDDCVTFIRKNLKGNIVSVRVEECYSLDLTVEATPRPNNPFHTSVYSEIPGYINDEAAFDLARLAVTEYSE